MTFEIEKSGPPYLFRYRSNSEFTIDELENSYIYFSDRKELNDPYDSIPNLINLTNDAEELKSSYNLILENINDSITKSYFNRKFSADNVKDLINESLEPFLNQFGIACFSINQLNLPLWANYSNNSKGICLQFNMNKDVDFFKNWRPVTYETDLKQTIFNPSTNQSGIMDVFFRKLKLWDKEYEIRLVKQQKGKIKFKNEALANVILGYNIEINYKDKIIKTIKKNYRHTSIFQMKKPTELKTISFTKI
jgi:hypothetical protein